GTSRKQKEAINIDTPDATTGGFTQNWSSFDCTPVKNVIISDNIFSDLESAIGTHRYSGGKVHTGITITGNLIFNMSDYGIRAMNWKKAVIEGNDFCNTGNYEDEVYAVILNGTSGMKISSNRFVNLSFGISAYSWKNSKLTGKTGGSQYDRIFNVITDKEIELFKKNYYYGLENNYIEIYDNQTDSLKEKDLTKYEYLPEYALDSAF
ncbi:MAG: right-handed parallel beta-helix repeat-containing protein, partial [Lachnospiraceae bacterium]|nr:right-handed parallel beta-helix repeat-containing protein [Lachnospiraceae bacterium]